MWLAKWPPSRFLVLQMTCINAVLRSRDESLAVIYLPLVELMVQLRRPVSKHKDSSFGAFRSHSVGSHGELNSEGHLVFAQLENQSQLLGHRRRRPWCWEFGQRARVSASKMETLYTYQLGFRLCFRLEESGWYSREPSDGIQRRRGNHRRVTSEVCSLGVFGDALIRNSIFVSFWVPLCFDDLHLQIR